MLAGEEECVGVCLCRGGQLLLLAAHLIHQIRQDVRLEQVVCVNERVQSASKNTTASQEQ